VRPTLKNIPLIIVNVFLSIAVFSQCEIHTNYYLYNVKGMSSTIQWLPSSTNSVVCSSSDWQPSFFVNNDSLLNVRISGDIVFNEGMNDDDFVGFVFGYKTSANGNKNDVGDGEQNYNHYYLFDWRKNYQEAPASFGGFPAREGFNLSYTNGILPTDPVSVYRSFWGHFLSENFLPIEHLYGNDLGWNPGNTYKFELIYTSNKIIISIDGSEIFNVDGDYEPGLFGLYSFNQNGVVYENVVYEQYYDIEVSDNFICKGVEMEMGFLNENNPIVPPSLTAYEWNFGDGSSNSNELFPHHTYEEEGGRTIELYLKDINACTDTIRRSIVVEPDPFVIQQPENIECLVGDDILFSILAQGVNSYQWYFQNGDENDWVKLAEDGHYSGISTRELTVTNVRPEYDGYKYRCILEGYCGIESSSSHAEISIVDNPARALLSLSRHDICLPDTTVLFLTIKEVYLLQSARMNIVYDADNIEILDYDIRINEDAVDVTVNEDHIIINYNITSPFMSDELVLVSFTIMSKAKESKSIGFGWDESDTYFINMFGDHITHLLYGIDLNMYKPLLNSFSDTMSLCYGTELFLDEQLFRSYNWSSGENASSFRIEDKGLYWVDLVDTNYCHSVDTFYVNLLEKPNTLPVINLNQSYYCSYEDEIELSIETNGENILLLSYLDEIITDSLNDVYSFIINNPGSDFEITASMFNSCGHSEAVSSTVQMITAIEPSVSIINDTINKADIHLGERVLFKAEFVGGGDNPNFIWWIDDLVKQNGSDDMFATNELKGIQKIKLELFSDAKCLLNNNYAISQIEFRLENADEVFAPTIITPNGNSLNSAFKVIFRDDNVYNYQLQIYNINGQLVFSTQDRYEYWSGNDVQNSAVGLYTYKFEYSLDLKPTVGQMKVMQGKFLLHK